MFAPVRTYCHPDNNVLFAEIKERLGAETGRSLRLQYSSVFAPVGEFSYNEYLLYQFIGKSEWYKPLITGTNTPRTQLTPICLSDGDILGAIVRERRYCSIQPPFLDINDNLATSSTTSMLSVPLPQLPYVKIDPAQLPRIVDGSKYLTDSTPSTGPLANMVEFQGTKPNQTIFVHPAAVVHFARQLLDESMDVTGAKTTALLEKAQMVATCADAVLESIRGSNQNEDTRLMRETVARIPIDLSNLGVTEYGFEVIHQKILYAGSNVNEDTKIRAEVTVFLTVTREYMLVASVIARQAIDSLTNEL